MEEERELKVKQGLVSDDVFKLLTEKGYSFSRCVVSQSRAAKWLREQYGLFIDIYRNNGIYSVTILDMYGNYNKNHRLDFEIGNCCDDYASYEEALNEGLERALEFI